MMVKVDVFVIILVNVQSENWYDISIGYRVFLKRLAIYLILLNCNTSDMMIIQGETFFCASARSIKASVSLSILLVCHYSAAVSSLPEEVAIVLWNIASGP
jgi:hypothetical protein